MIFVSSVEALLVVLDVKGQVEEFPEDWIVRSLSEGFDGFLVTFLEVVDSVVRVFDLARSFSVMLESLFEPRLVLLECTLM